MSYQMRPAPCLLIVEDDPVVGLVIEEMVRDQGWQVVGPVRRLEEAIEAAKSEDLDFALLDFDLGEGTNSLPVAQALSSRSVSYCFLTGTDPANVRAVAGDAPLTTKPVSLFELQRILKAARPQLSVLRRLF
jgi:DNA-binding response OmpR family regulator